MVGSWLLVGPVAVTEHAGDLPLPVLIAPHDHEIGDPVALATRELAEAMRALRNGAEVLDRENLERAGDQLPAEIATHMLFRVREHVLPRPGDAAIVVIELDIGHEIAGVLLKLLRDAAMVESVEYSGVKRGDGVEQRIGGLSGGRHAACSRGDWRNARSDQGGNQRNQLVHAGLSEGGWSHSIGSSH